MSKSLPPRANLDWYRKLAKQKLKAAQAPATLAGAQRAVARAHGFTSWRQLVAAVTAQRQQIDPTALLTAIRDNDERTVAQLLNVSPGIAHTRSPDGAPWLSVAVELNRPAIVKRLLDAGADPHATYGRGAHTPLSWAMTVGAFRSADVLLSAGIKPDLFCAAGLDRVDAVAAFFDTDGYARAGASTTGSSRYAGGQLLPCPPADPVEVASDALYIAARNGRIKTVKFLLSRKIDLAFRAYMGATPLHWANFNGTRKVIDLLVTAGADESSRDYTIHATPRAFGICVPAQWGHITLLKRATARDKSLVNLLDARGTALHEAARNGQAGSVRVLLKAGANPLALDRDGKTPRDLAADNRHDAVAALLQSAKSVKWSVDALPAHRRSHKIVQWKPLMDAAFTGDVAAAKKLLDAGADPNVISTTPHRHRPLHRAIERKKTAPRGEAHVAVAKLLLERGADPHSRATHGKHTALQLAAIDSPIFVPVLRERFEPLDFCHAVVLLDAKRVAALLKRDKSLAAARDENDWLPLHYCAASAIALRSPAELNAQQQVARLLLDAGADPNGTYQYGEWPLSVLFYACGYHNNPAMTELLMTAGASACDNEAVYHASDEKHAACLAVIERLTDPKDLAAECTACLPTQLHWGHTAGIPWLLAHGADPTVKGRLGRSALEIAKAAGKDKIVAQLQAAVKNRR